MVSFEPTRCPNGFNDRESTQFPDCLMPILDPTKHIVYFNDFIGNGLLDATVDSSGNWTDTITQAGAGSATAALTSVQGGALLLTNDAADNDNFFKQLKTETFKFVVGKKTWFKTRFQVSDVTQSDFIIGLQITDTTPLAVTDGVYFRKDDGDTNLDFVVIKNSTATTTTVAATTTGLADATYITLNFYYNGESSIKIYANGTLIGTSVTTNLVDDEELTISFGIQNGEAVAKTMTVDYILAVQER